MDEIGKLAKPETESDQNKGNVMATGGEKDGTAGSVAKELLLKDYDYLADSFWKNEEVGEKRVDFFMGLVTAVVAGLVALINAKNVISGQSLRLTVVASLVVLLMIGAITLQRLIKRNNVTDGYKQGLDKIRQLIKDCYDPDEFLRFYKPMGGAYRERWPPGECGKVEDKPGQLQGTACQAERAIWRRIRRIVEMQSSIRRWAERAFCKKLRVKKLDAYLEQELQDDLKGARTFGGLVDFVSGINAMLLTGVVAASFYCPDSNVYLVFLLAFVVFFAAFMAQHVYIMVNQAIGRHDLKEKSFTHESGIVYKIVNGEARYLLVSAKGKKNWVLPKGHIREGECFGKTAFREVQEEAEVKAEMKACAGEVSFFANKERMYSRGFLMLCTAEGEGHEGREKIWLTRSELASTALHDETRALLDAAEELRLKLK